MNSQEQNISSANYQEQNISANNFEDCIKCTICTVYCPVTPFNPNYPGHHPGRSNQIHKVASEPSRHDACQH